MYNVGFGQSVENAKPLLYLSPDSPTDRQPFAQLPADGRDAIYNDTGIVKAQYTHQMGQNAYARLMAYTFYSDWNQTGANSANANYLFGYPAQALAANYLLSTHTAGALFQVADQINSKNLLEFTSNYTQATVLRDNNSGFTSGSLGRTGPIGLFSGNASSGYTCYNPGTGAPTPCYNIIGSGDASVYSAAQVANGFFNPAAGPPPGSAAALAGVQYSSLWDGPTKGSYNTVGPKFLNASLSDQFRPSDRWLFNGAVRYESYRYGLATSTTPADQFYGNIISSFTCYNVQSGVVLSAPLLPGQYPPASPVYTNADCNTAYNGLNGVTNATGWVHPNGTTQDGTKAPLFSVNSPSAYNLNYWSARFSGTYTMSPDTVIRFSGGRFVEPPISASVDYLDQSGNNTGQWANFMNLGFFTPFHNVPAQTSGQYDVSLERHIRGTDLSFKLTPFYNLTNGYQEQSFIGAGFVTQVPVGRFRSYGVEGALTKGDFSRNGLSGQLSLTYTNARVQYQSGLVNNLGVNQITTYNQAIASYNALAKGGSQNYACFNPATTAGAGSGVGTPGVAATCTGTTIANPYFTAPKQSLLDPSGWYAPASDVALPGVNTGLGLYDAPFIGSLILNYRHDRFSVTPSVQIVSGSSYGSPFTTQGVDPRDCTTTDPNQTGNQCNYTSLLGAGATPTGLLYVPNWQTGTFDSVGQYRDPNLVVGNIAFSYEVSPRVSLNLTLANIYHTCFGGSKEPWSTAYPASSSICGYGANGLQVSNYQLGSGYAKPDNAAAYSASANGTSLYPWQFQSYAPSNGSFAGTVPAPFNAYFTVNVRL